MSPVFAAIKLWDWIKTNGKSIGGFVTAVVAVGGIIFAAGAALQKLDDNSRAFEKLSVHVASIDSVLHSESRMEYSVKRAVASWIAQDSVNWERDRQLRELNYKLSTQHRQFHALDSVINRILTIVVYDYKQYK